VIDGACETVFEKLCDREKECERVCVCERE
jgi:hypothetical protein